ncbi:MAG: SDR family oxidoreductase [Pedobacter sp.]|nr:SDR family oxidoreductase [Pedobacter sp.]
MSRSPLLPATVITGASSGIGEAIARRLATEEKQTLVLVARRTEKLDALATELQQKHGLRVYVISLDLEKPGAARELLQAVALCGLSIDTLINNAGFGLNDAFSEMPLDRIQAMMQLNMITLTELCHAVLPGMHEHRHGRILNVASILGFQSCPRFAVYAATKSFVLSFTEALAREERRHGIHVTAVCPGSTRTSFHDVAGNTGTVSGKIMNSPDMVAASALRALRRGNAVIVPGLFNKPLPFLLRFVPRSLGVFAASLLVYRTRNA